MFSFASIDLKVWKHEQIYDKISKKWLEKHIISSVKLIQRIHKVDINIIRKLFLKVIPLFFYTMESNETKVSPLIFN